MATEVQIALQPQAGQDPAAALTAAAAKLARASLEMLVQQAGQPITGKILPPPQGLPTGFSQVAVADMVLTLKLSMPLPAGTPVRIDVQQTAGQPAVTVQPMPSTTQPQPQPLPAPPIPQAAVALPSMPRPAAPLMQQASPPTPQPAATTPTPSAPVPAPPLAAQPQPTGQSSVAPQAPSQTAAVAPAPAPVQAAQTAPAPTPTPQPVTGSAPAAAPTPAVTAQPAPPPAVPPMAASPASTPAPAPQSGTPSSPVQLAPSQPATVQVSQSTPAAPQSQAPTAAPSAPPPAPTASGPAIAQPQAQTAPPPTAAQAPLPTVQPAPAPPPQAMMQRLTQAFSPPPATATASPPPPVPGSPAQLVMAATTQAAAQQQSPAPLMQALAASLPHLPAPVAEAAARVLATRINLDRGVPAGDALKQAVLKSGVFLDAPAKAGASPDLRQALGQLRSTLLAWLGDDTAPVAAVARRPSPPPARGSAPRGQAPELPQAMEGGAKEAGKSLLGQTDSALARIRLMQLGSQPIDARASAPIAAPTEWTLELPMMLGHELAMAQIQIQRDGKGKTEAKDRNWRLRFALKFSVLGEVGAQVTMVGARASIAIWADEETTAETLDEMLPELAPALAAKGLELVSLTVRRGVPKDENQPAGRLMDSVR